MTPADCAAYWHSHIAIPGFNPEVETLVVLLLEADGEVIAHEIVATGERECVCATPTAIFKPAYKYGARQIILMHNHPHSHPLPSMNDLAMTAELVTAAKLLRLTLRDHVIIGKPLPGNTEAYCSLAGLGYFHS